MNPKKTVDEDEIIPSRLDLRVGKIVSVEKVRHIYYSIKQFIMFHLRLLITVIALQLLTFLLEN